eukprot:4892931-Amphidinium_carterae.2
MIQDEQLDPALDTKHQNPTNQSPVIRAVPQTGAMEIEADQRHVDMILRELGIDAGVRGKYLPSVKMTAVERGQVAATAALTGEKVWKYRSFVMRIAYLSLDRADLLECVRHIPCQINEPREGDWCRVQRVNVLDSTCSGESVQAAASPEFVRVIVDSDHTGEP